MSSFTAKFSVSGFGDGIQSTWCFFSPVFFDGISFYSPVFSRTHPLWLKPIHDAKVPGDDKKALTIPLPLMRSTTQTRAHLNTNAPNLPQLPTVRGLSPVLGLSRWSPWVPNPAAEILRMTIEREKLTTTGPTTVQRLHGREFFFLMSMLIWLPEIKLLKD